MSETNTGEVAVGTVAYFRLMAGDDCPCFEPVSHFMGMWSGVAKVQDAAEIDRLRKLKKVELTEAEYAEEVKKKAQPRDSSQLFRQVNSDLNPPRVQRAQVAVADRGEASKLVIDTPAKTAATSTQKPAIEIPSLAQLSTPSAIPSQRSSKRASSDVKASEPPLFGSAK